MQSPKKYTLNLTEIVFLCIGSALLAGFWLLWTGLYTIISPPLKLIGLAPLLDGPWMMGALLFPFLIRKPGVAIFGESITALFQGMLSQWGPIALISGLVQALLPELIFALSKYKKWNVYIMMLAGMCAALTGHIYHTTLEGNWSLDIRYLILSSVAAGVSGAFLGGLLSYGIGKKLYKNGAFSLFLSQNNSIQ